MLDWEKIFAQLAVVTGSPVPFTVAVLICCGLVWLLMERIYRSIIDNRDSEIALLKGQRDDYKEKLNGATPDEAKARIDALETRLAALEPRRLTSDQRASLIARLGPPAGATFRIVIVSEVGGNGSQFAADFASVFRSVGGWTVSEGQVMGAGHRSASGLLVKFASQPAPAAQIIMAALQAARIEFDALQSQIYEQADVELLVCVNLSR